MEIYAKRFLREVSYTLAVMGKMEDIREIIKATNIRDINEIGEAKKRIREILTTKAEYIRDIARMCETDAKVIISALLQNDMATAGRLCEEVVREAKNLVSKAMDLRRDIGEAEDFGRW